MNKLEFMRLWDCYYPILTPTQQEITNLYFNLDLTISEIAVEKGISRQAVSDCLSGCKRQLEELEEKLRFVKATGDVSLQLSLKLTGARRWAEEFESAHPEFKDEIKQLEDILERDFSAEAKSALDKK